MPRRLSEYGVARLGEARGEILQVMASCCLGAFAHGTVNTIQMNSFVVTAFESHERVS